MFIWDRWPAYFRGCSGGLTGKEVRSLEGRHQLIVRAMHARTALATLCTGSPIDSASRLVHGGGSSDHSPKHQGLA